MISPSVKLQINLKSIETKLDFGSNVKSKYSYKSGSRGHSNMDD